MEPEANQVAWDALAEERAARTDLANAIGLVIRTPSYLFPSNTEDPNPGIDIIEEHNRLIAELKRELFRLSLGVGLNNSDEIPHHRYYLGPPRAGAWPFSIDLIEVANQFDALVQNLAAYVEVGVGLLSIGRWWTNRLVSCGRYDAERDRPVFLGQAILLMCVGHMYEQYGVSPTGEPSGFLRLGAGASIDHPTGSEIYTVSVPSKRRAYIYVVTAKGGVFEHFVLERGRATGLELPDFFGDAQLYREARQACELP